MQNNHFHIRCFTCQGRTGQGTMALGCPCPLKDAKATRYRGARDLGAVTPWKLHTWLGAAGSFSTMRCLRGAKAAPPNQVLRQPLASKGTELAGDLGRA